MSMGIEASPFSQSALFGGKNVHLGITGSVACYKACDLLRALIKAGIVVSATVTGGAGRFMSPLLVKALGAKHVYSEIFGADVFGHLEPGQNADCFAIVPATANIMAKMATGIADDMLSAQLVAFNGPLLVAPSMNPSMWAHPATRANAKTLAGRGCAIVEPGSGLAACGDAGQGRLAELAEIYLAILKCLSPQDLAGKRVLVTLGPTREPWDGARIWTNPSSGRMGAALATAAWLRGAEVTAICGPWLDVYLPGSIRRVAVSTAQEMLAAAEKAWPDAALGMFCAAVSDFAPVRPKGEDGVKLKKADLQSPLSIEFTRNPDILLTLSGSKSGNQKILGFAAEITPDLNALIPLASAKLKAKNADVIAANRVNHGVGAFGADVAQMAVVDRNGNEEIWPPQPKADIAWELVSWLLKI